MLSQSATVKLGFYAKAVRAFYTDMKEAPYNDPDFQRSVKVATRAFEGIVELRDLASCPTEKARASDGG